MGKAAVDLPDPARAAAPETSASVDDLLAQMAGDEIDRLLAEVDDVHAGAPPAATATPPKSPAAAPSIPPANNEVLADANPGEALASSPAPAAAAAPATPPPAAVALQEDEVAKQLDELFALGATAAPAAIPKPAGSDPAVVPPGEFDVATSTAERSALDAAMPAAPEAPLSMPELADDVPDERGTPFYLKPLEWLNAPLDACPEPIRELIGKVALVTLFNATAVLIYVFLFRKHHH